MHPLQSLMADAGHFLLIGDSSKDRFPGYSFHAYTVIGRTFSCLDLGGLSESRGPTSGAPVYTSVDDLPDTIGDLAIIWVTASRNTEAVEAAKAAGCSKVWFSFRTATAEGVNRARELDLEIVEIGRCPVYYLDRMVPICKGHTLMLKLSGSYKKPSQTDAEAKRRELW